MRNLGSNLILLCLILLGFSSSCFFVRKKSQNVVIEQKVDTINERDTVKEDFRCLYGTPCVR